MTLNSKPERHTILKVECGWCGIPMGEKEGYGVKGTTSAMCPDCVLTEMMRTAQRYVKTRKISWAEAKREVGLDSNTEVSKP